MNTIQRLLVATAMLFAAGAAVAAPQDHRDHDRGRQGYDHRDDRHDNRHYDHRGDDRHYDRRYDHRYDNHRGYYGGYYRHDYYRPAPRYYRPAPYYGGHWVRGHRYGGPRYYVDNWNYYHLRQPPYGYRWVRADDDFLLVAIATGVILDIATQ
ncbi:MAG TPA: RcnB family protein [Dyella sp.]|uniref:RcnB family protein n=1 Tax=Dyella sp. TaxID=1869338 RepID=UPI002F94EDCD